MAEAFAARERIWRAIWRHKLHVEPRALDLAPHHVREHYEHIWAPAERLRSALKDLPLGLLALWRDAEAGHVVFTHLPSRYVPGEQPWHSGVLIGVCYLSVTELLDDVWRALRAWLDLLDHLLGSGARPEGGRFSSGAGLTPRLQEAAQRFLYIESLGYGHRELGAAHAGDYFALTLALYLRDPRRLNV
ncbi:MAG: hypothetical protein H5T69_16035, partial [Chloroflexi bacterium]|nr:hypothetical protein [Chloroflexota bacterium]